MNKLEFIEKSLEKQKELKKNNNISIKKFMN